MPSPTPKKRKSVRAERGRRDPVAEWRRLSRARRLDALGTIEDEAQEDLKRGNESNDRGNFAAADRWFQWSGDLRLAAETLRSLSRPEKRRK